MKTLSGKIIQRRIIIPTLFLTVLSFTALGVVLIFNTYSVVVSAMEYYVIKVKHKRPSTKDRSH